MTKQRFFVSLSSRSRGVFHVLGAMDRCDPLDCYDAIGVCGTRSTYYHLSWDRDPDTQPLCAKCEGVLARREGMSPETREKLTRPIAPALGPPDPEPSHVEESPHV